MPSLRAILAPLLCLLVVALAEAGPIERALETRWRGAWIILDIETRSDCNDSYTNNRVNGRLSQGRGAQLFEPGELARIENLNVHRSRVDVLVSLPEPVRVSYQDGPFTLYDRRYCKVELEIEVPRADVKSKNIDAIDALMRQAMEAYPTEAEARDSDSYGGRACRPFPEDYEQTLHEWRIWKAEETNRMVAERIRATTEGLAALTDAFSQSPAYVDGFAAGVARMRARGVPNSCEALVGGRIAPVRHDPPTKHGGGEVARREWHRGYADGQRFVLLARSAMLLERCFVEVPR